MKLLSIGAGGVVVGLCVAGTLAGCGGGSSPSPAPSTSSPSSSAAATPTVTVTASAAVNYRQQYLADVQPWDAAVLEARGTGLTSGAAHAAGRAAVATARKLLTQSWPAADESDVHTLAVAFDTLNEDIVSDNLTKYENDGTTLNADTNVVRAELGLASIR